MIEILGWIMLGVVIQLFNSLILSEFRSRNK
jgi:hypothetical protein